jgi:hypothetical protein
MKELKKIVVYTFTLSYTYTDIYGYSVRESKLSGEC